MSRNRLLQCYGTFKMPLIMFISILVFRPEGQIWNPVRRDTRIYVRRILNASRISKTQLNSCTVSICRMGESGLVIRLAHAQCSVITEDGEQGFSRTGPMILVYMESYCISVVCKL